MNVTHWFGAHLCLLVALSLIAATRVGHADPPFTTLYSFSGSDGDNPYAGLLQAKDGALYGTTLAGGTNNDGTVFKITTPGALTSLYSFRGTDGAICLAGLIPGQAGALYGATGDGGVNNNGTVFRITTSGVFTTLYSFSVLSDGTNADGANPSAALIQGRDGNLYGTTLAGGVYGGGAVFKLTMIPVITSFSPTSGPVGTSITVTGVNFTEVAVVEIGTVPSNFTINSDTSLTLSVPAGVKSAKITVVSPFGTGVSGKVFKITR